MAEIKKINTELQPLDKLLDTSGDAGTSGQILTSTGTGTNWVPAATPGTGIYLPLVGGTLTGPLTVGASTDGHDVFFYGDAAGEGMLWDESESRLTINHDTNDSGLDVFTVSSASMTQPQIRVGRDVNQFWGVYTDDRNAHLVHRQDETTGTMTTRFDQWDSNTSDTTGNWVWRSGDGSGSSMSTALELKQSGDAIFSGNVDVTGGSLESRTTTADAYTPTAFNDKSLLTLRNLTGDTNYAGIQFSNSTGNYEWFQGAVQITAARADYVFQGYDTTTTAYKEHLRIKDNSDISFAGNATFANLVTVGPGTTGSAYDSTTFLHIKGTTRSIVQQSSTNDAYYMFGDADANNVAWLGYDHSSGNLNLQAETSITLNKNTNVVGTFGVSGNITTLAKVGIGTTTPQAFTRLDVRSGNVNGNHAIAGYGYNGVGGAAILGHGFATDNTHAGSSTGIRGISNGSRTVTGSINIGGQFTASGAVSNYAIITTAGNVGINNTTPTFALDVIGTARVSGNTEFPTQSTSDDSSKVATTAFVKNILAEQPAGLSFLGSWDADTNSPTLVSGGGELADGAVTSVAANKLNDTNATFQSDSITVNADRVRVVQANGNIAFSVITTVNSDTQLTLTDDIATAVGDTYIVEKSPFLSPEGGYYIVGTSGDENLNGITDWVVGDWALIATTNVFQKIDNTSVLSGSGSGGSVAGWTGSGTSVALGDAPITFSGSNSTFAGGLTGTTGTFSGNVNVSGDIEIDNSSGDPFLKLKTAAQEYVLRIDQSDSEKFQIRNTTSSVTALSIDTSSDATFVGSVSAVGLNLSSATGPIITLTDTDASIGVDSIIGHIAFVGTEIGSETSRIASVSETAGGEAGLRFYTGASVTQALQLNKDQNATFAGNVTLESASPVLKIDATDTGNPEIYFTRLTGDDQNAKIILGTNQLRFENEGDPDGTFLFQGRAAGAGSLSDFLKIEDTGITAPGATFSGNVEINKTDPQIKLKAGTQDVAWLGDFGGGTDGQLLLFNNAGVLKVSLNGEANSYINGGNVGIGTTSPASKLDVNSNISSSSVGVITLSQATDGAIKPAASLGLSIGNGGEATNAADLWFTTASGGALSEKMRISSNGTVLINATAPTQTYATGSPIKLSVQDGMSEFETTLTNNDDWENSPVSILERANIGSGSTDNKYAPNLNFHWSARVSNSLWMDYQGALSFGAYSSAGVPDRTGTFHAAHGIFNSSVEAGALLKFGTNGFADIVNIGTGAIRFKPSGQTLALTLTGANATFEGQVTGPTPTTTTSFANKAYVDAHGGGLGPFLPLAGNSTSTPITGTVFFDRNITSQTKMQLFCDGTGQSGIRSENGDLMFRVNGSSSQDIRFFGRIDGTATDEFYRIDSGTERNEFMHDVVIGKRVGLNMTSTTGDLVVSSGVGSNGDCVVVIEADTDNTVENSTPILKLQQDGGTAFAHFGMNGETNNTFTGAIANAGYIRSGLDFQIAVKDDELSTTFTNSGDVGIGTQSPGDKLEVYGASSNISITNTSETDSGIVFRDAQALATQAAAIKFNSSDNKLKFFVNDEVAQRMVIDTAGNVGINAVSPTKKLYVEGDAYFGDTVSIASTSDKAYLNIIVSDSGNGNSGQGLMYLQNTNTTTSGGAMVLAIRNDYGAGFGNYIKFFNHTGATIGEIFANSGRTNVVYSTSSDYRLKEDLKPFKGLDIIDQIPVHDFKYKEANLRGYGVMAHELQAVLPELVKGKKDGEEMQSVDYIAIVPILMQSIKELKAELEDLKSKI